MRYVIIKRTIFVNIRLSIEKKEIRFTTSLTDVEFQSNTFETTKWMDLRMGGNRLDRLCMHYNS